MKYENYIRKLQVWSPSLLGRVGVGLLLLALTACRTTQKTTEQTDSLAVRVSVQDSTRRDIQLRFDELVYWVGQAPLLSPARGEDTIRTATPPYGGGWEGLYVKIKNGDYKRQEEQKTEVLNNVTDEHTKSTQKILKPPKIPIGFVVCLLLIGGIVKMWYNKYFGRSD